MTAGVYWAGLAEPLLVELNSSRPTPVVTVIAMHWHLNQQAASIWLLLLLHSVAVTQ